MRPQLKPRRADSISCRYRPCACSHHPSAKISAHCSRALLATLYTGPFPTVRSVSGGLLMLTKLFLTTAAALAIANAQAPATGGLTRAQERAKAKAQNVPE